jgi:hypothetical protein
MNDAGSVEDLSLPDVRREAINKTRTTPQN